VKLVQIQSKKDTNIFIYRQIPSGATCEKELDWLKITTYHILK